MEPQLRIPNHFHFILFVPQPQKTTEFLWMWYMAILSAKVVNKPERIYLHLNGTPTGRWWDEVRNIVEVTPASIPVAIGSKPIKQQAHMADCLRMETLLQHGGIYMDLDTI